MDALKKKKFRSSASQKSEKPRLVKNRFPAADKKEQAFPIVALGASAGGLKAFEQFFPNMPPDSGMGFVLIPHLDPDHISLLPDLLRKYTKMTVIQAGDGIKVQANCIYVIPPNREMAIMHGTLLLTEPAARHGLRLPIDTFFLALANDRKERAIAIILSGNGSDGTLGLRAIKAEGGIAMVQDPDTAEYDSMPRNALQTGLVDYSLAPEKMPAELIKYVKHPYLKAIPGTVAVADRTSDALRKIFYLLRMQTGHDFSLYKTNTIRRRIERRMSIQQVENISQYLRLLQQNSQEVAILFKEILIGVTNFFRDAEAFEALSKRLIKETLADKPKDYSMRVWVPGCSSGEEAYSIAIVLRECADKLKRNCNVQIFATDIDPDAINAARAGFYPASIVANVTAARLKRFFAKEGHSYRIKKEIREIVVFAVQDLIKDPPFTKLDLLSCRNLLIYFDAALQKKLLPLFHYALQPDGILFLGPSESIGGASDLFTLIDKKWKLLKPKGSRFVPESVTSFPAGISRGDVGGSLGQGEKSEGKDLVFSKAAEKMLLDEYAPPSVLIRPDGEILYAHGRTGKYLELAQGRASLNILEMAEGIRHELEPLIRKAETQKKQVSMEGLQVKANGEFQRLNLTVKPLHQTQAIGDLMIVAFEEIAPKTTKSRKAKALGGAKAAERILQLEQELQYSREHLQTTIEDLETANEELKSANEELQSTNEESQSTNEELETSKEEMQSLNEELVTVNAELQCRIDELSSANDDMKNLFDASKIAMIFLDQKLCIRRFTKETTKIINLIPTDVGRPVCDIVANLEVADLAGDAREVMDSLVAKEKNLRSRDGHWYLMRILPYRTVDNVIDGVVVTLSDITELKRAEDLINEAYDYAESIVDTVREPMLVLDAGLKVLSANRSFYRTFKDTSETTLGKSIFKLGNEQWNIAELRQLLEQILSENTAFEDFLVERDFAQIGRKKMLLNGRRIYRDIIGTQTLLLAIEDVTERNQMSN
jgi:two-component system CheB/CheR fusion protein